MMRINLLEESSFQTARKPESGFALPQLRAAGNLPTVMLSAGLVIAVGVGAIWGMLLIKDRADLDARIEMARIEQARLAHVLERAEDRRGTREELSRRIGVIINLKRMQDLPVHLLELMSTSLANFVCQRASVAWKGGKQRARHLKPHRPEYRARGWRRGDSPVFTFFHFAI